MPKFLEIRSGQVTSLAKPEQPAGAWTQLQNAIATADGLHPLEMYLNPVGYTYYDTTNAAPAGLGLLKDSSALVWHRLYTNSTGTSISSALGKDPITLGDAHGTAHAFTTAITPSDKIRTLYGSARVTAAVELQARELLFDGNNVYASVGEYLPTSGEGGYSIYRYDVAGGTWVQVVDTKNSSSTKPYGRGLGLLDEYLLRVAGQDDYATPGTLQEKPLRFRWSSPGTYDEWKPDLTNSPPQWLSGYIDARGIGPFLDMFSYLGRVYCPTAEKLWVFSKVGGDVGFSMKSLDVRLRYLGDMDNFGNAVATSRGVFLLTADGLYSFDGASANAVQEQSEALFSRDWFRDTFSTITLIDNKVRGLHVPLLDTVMWFVQAYDTSNNPLTVVLCYNYEQKVATYLQSPAGVQFLPLFGLRPGMCVWDTSYSNSPTCRVYTFERNVGTSDIPAVSYTWKTGYMTGQNFDRKIFLDKLFFHGSFLASGQSCTLTISAFDEDGGSATQTQTLTITTTDLARGFVRTRVQGRYLQATLSWTPLTSKTSTLPLLVLRGLSVDAMETGARR